MAVIFEGKNRLRKFSKRLPDTTSWLLNQLGKLSNIQLDNSIITSLLYPHDDVTVSKAIQRKGERYGFYGKIIDNKDNK